MNLEKRLSRRIDWFLERPRTSGWVVFLFLLTIIVFTTYQRYQIIRKDKQKELNNILNIVRQNIDQSLKNSYTATLTLALTLNDDGLPENFDSVAAQLIHSNPNLQAVQLVPDGVIRYIYPLKGNEAALNYDILRAPAYISKEAYTSIKEKKLYFAGPVKLRQGGVGIVGRLPVFQNNKFWGFSAVVIRMEELLRLAGMQDVHDNYYFQFSKKNPVSHQEEFFLPRKYHLFGQTRQSVSFPEGDWKLYIISPNGYEVFSRIATPFAFGTVMALVCGLLVTAVLKKPSELQGLVHAQTALLLNNEIRYKAIFDHAGIGIAQLNSNTGDILQVNHKYLEMLGYTEEELTTMNFHMITYPDDLPENLENMEKLKSGLIRGFTMRKRLLNKQRETIWVNLTVSPLWNAGALPSNHIAMVEDIDARKAVEDEILASQQKIESLINTIDGIVWESDPETFKFQFISKKAEDILGYPVEQWLNDPTFWVDHIHPEDRDWVVKFCLASTKENEQHDFEYRMIARDGSTVWLRDIVNVIKEHHQPVKLRGIMIDITRQKQAEIDLNNSFQLVTEQNKRLLNFSYIVSHNLRSHTSNIESLSGLIETAASDKEREELIRLLKTVSGNLNETMLNLNEVVNIQSQVNLTIECLNLREYIGDTLKVLNGQVSLSSAKIENEVPDSVFVQYNPAYLQSVLLNFISNAIRYRHPDRQPVVSLSCLEENGRMVLQISDNGSGIDLEKNGAQLFGMYKTFNGNPDARGIGLFISKNQIDAMGGGISVESTLGEGSTFKIYFA